jgi:hypothetical protein
MIILKSFLFLLIILPIIGLFFLLKADKGLCLETKIVKVSECNIAFGFQMGCFFLSREVEREVCTRWEK